MTITVIGAGYVGLVTAAIFSDLGNRVYCVDVIKERIENLKKSIIPFYEPQLAEFVERNVKEKRLNFTTSYSESVPKSQIVFICVGTPPKPDNGEADLSYLFTAVEEAAKNLQGYTLITIKSTIPLGYEDDLENLVSKHAKAKYEFAASPEFLREGTAIEDSLHPDRIVIGTSSKKAAKILLELHAPLPGERLVCDIRSAQLIKYASNAFLATKVSYANAIAAICEKVGADVEIVLKGVGLDKRLGRHFLYPGVGYGGSCLPKDVTAFIALASKFDYDFSLLKTVDYINKSQTDRFINKIRSALGTKDGHGQEFKGIKLAILGLAFKPNTDDMRDAPSINIIKQLLNLGADITAYDPQAMDVAKKIFPNVNYTADAYNAASGKDALVIITEWPQFRELDMNKIKNSLKRPIIIDGRNIYDKDKLKSLGFTYIGVGR